jgi:hypothetical protein
MTFEERSLVAELRRSGHHVDSIWDWANTPGAPYRAAEPILVRYLDRSTDERLVEGLARRLSMRCFHGARAALARKFRAVDDESVRWAIGNALSVVGFDGIESEVIRMARDRRYGRGRQMLVGNLYRIKQPIVERVLIGLLDDPDVDAFAATSLGYHPSKKVLKALRSLSLDGRSPVAKRSIKKSIARVEKQLAAA